MIQIDMEMPKKCFDCPFVVNRQDSCGDFYLYCSLLGSNNIIYGEVRFRVKRKDCPLKEVKEKQNE